MDYRWFKLLVRAIGILLIGLSVPMLLWNAGFLVVGLNEAPNRGGMWPTVLARIPGIAGYLAQAGIGFYLLLGAERLIGRCIREVLGRCVVCGYDLAATTGDNCPECGTRIGDRSTTRPPTNG